MSTAFSEHFNDWNFYGKSGRAEAISWFKSLPEMVTKEFHLHLSKFKKKIVTFDQGEYYLQSNNMHVEIIDFAIAEIRNTD